MAKITIEFEVPDNAAIDVATMRNGPGAVPTAAAQPVAVGTPAAPAAPPAPSAAPAAPPAPKAPAAPPAPPAPPAAPKAPPAPPAPPPAAPAPAQASAADQAADKAVLDAGWTLEGVQGWAKSYSETNSVKAMAEIVKGYGVKKVQDVPPRFWPELAGKFGAA